MRYNAIQTQFLLFCLMLSSAAMAQISIDQDDMPTAGLVLTSTVTAALPDGLDPADTGAGMTWDYSGLQPGLDQVDTIFSVGSTPVLYQFFFNNQFIYPDYYADHARRGPDVNLGLATIEDTYTYFKNDEEGYRYVGYGASVNGLPVSVQNDPVDWVYEFPLQYGDESESFSSSIVDIPGLGAYQREQDRSVTIEGWGSLILPDGTYDVLKLRTEILATDSLYIAMTETGFAIEQPLQTTYEWLAMGEGQPILSITETAGFPGVQVNYKYDIDSSLEQLDALGVRIYPNPVVDQLMIDAPSKRIDSFMIYSANGALVAQERKPADANRAINVSGLETGSYFLMVEVEGQYYSSTFSKD